MNKMCSVFTHVNTSENLIALTFDDGPHPVYTPELLNILDEFDVKCTFFMIGENMELYPELVMMVNQRGHEIGNHTRTHPDLIEISKDEVYTEMELTHQEIYRQTKQYPRFFRPPYGRYNDNVLEACVKFDYDLSLWSDGLEMFDWELPGVETLVHTLISNVSPGCIILLHDSGGDRSQTIAAVRLALPLLKQKGYRFCRLDQFNTLQEVNHGHYQ
jgi:peptidoglycan/xylan/chitin deacetylase (PgdA/CDA1 family)